MRASTRYLRVAAERLGAASFSFTPLEVGCMRRSSRMTALSGLLFSSLLGLFVAGPLLYRSLIGLDPTAFPAGAFLRRVGGSLLSGLGVPTLDFPPEGLLLALLVLVTGALLTLISVGIVASAPKAAADTARRRFLRGFGWGSAAALGSFLGSGAAAVARAFYGVGGDGLSWSRVGSEIFAAPVEKTASHLREEWKGSRVRAYRRLGRTGFQASDIVLGTGGIAGEAGEQVARLALERGVNYLDTSPDYSAAGCEEALGRALRGRREEVFIATKFCTPQGHLPAGSPVAAYKAAVEGSLRRLATDRVDLVHIHSCDELDRLMDPNVHEAFDRLKAEGKVRFLGVSTHTPNLVRVAQQAIDSERFDVMMLAYHHGIWAPLAGILERAQRDQDMGIVAMKTLKGAKHHGLEGFREQADAYSQAAFKWVLSNPAVSCLVVSFFRLQHVDEYLYASGHSLTPQDVSLLRRYDELVAGSYCVPHCGECLSSCPLGLPISDVLRQRMYFEDYGWQKEAMRLYTQLERNASVCSTCTGPCLESCPVDISIPERMREAHDLLTLA